MVDVLKEFSKMSANGVSLLGGVSSNANFSHTVAVALNRVT